MHNSITNGRGLDDQLLIADVGCDFSGFLAAGRVDEHDRPTSRGPAEQY
jgi:hypothetical protein